jgi:hypothetical protein
MTDVIAVIAAGEMGAGIGKRLTERGARVLTSLKGRGPASRPPEWPTSRTRSWSVRPA